MIFRFPILVCLLFAVACTQMKSGTSAIKKGDSEAVFGNLPAEDQAIPPHLLNNTRLWKKTYYQQSPNRECLDAYEFTEDRKIYLDSCTDGRKLATDLEKLVISDDGMLLAMGPGIYAHSARKPEPNSAYIEAWCHLGNREDDISWEWRIRREADGTYGALYVIFKDGIEWVTINDHLTTAKAYEAERIPNEFFRLYWIKEAFANVETLQIAIPIHNPKPDGSYDSIVAWLHPTDPRPQMTNCRIAQ